MNRFILANKKLLEGMKFQWPKNPSEVKEIIFQQMEWLLAHVLLSYIIKTFDKF